MLRERGSVVPAFSHRKAWPPAGWWCCATHQASTPVTEGRLLEVVVATAAAASCLPFLGQQRGCFLSSMQGLVTKAAWIGRISQVSPGFPTQPHKGINSASPQTIQPWNRVLFGLRIYLQCSSLFQELIHILSHGDHRKLWNCSLP